MPKPTTPPKDYFLNSLGTGQTRQGIAAQQQTTIIVDTSQTTTDTTTGKSAGGPVVMAVGQIPNGMPTSTPRWASSAHPLFGHQIYGTNSSLASYGNPVAHYGTQPDGTHGLWSLDGTAAANPVLKVGEIIDSATFGSSTVYYGEALYNPSSGVLVGFLGAGPSGPALSIYDTSANLRASLGELPSGDYGLMVEDTLGNRQEILPAVYDYVDDTVTVTTTSGYATEGGPSVTADVGASMTVLLEASCYINTLTSDMTGTVGLYIDGTVYSGILTLSATAGVAAANVSTKRQITLASSGSHTFDLRYQASSSSGVEFAGRSLVVTPV